MANFNYNAKDLPAQNYPLRKVNAFIRKTTPKFLRPLHDAVDEPILNAVEPLADEFKLPAPGSKPVAGSAEEALQQSMNRNRNMVAPRPQMKKGGSVDKAMEKRHASWMASHGAPKKMVAEERKEAAGMNCGGKVKMAKGGSVRGDGIAQRGKTKGRFV